MSASKTLPLAGLLKTSFLFSHGEWTATAAPEQKRERKEAFKINLYEHLGMSVKEFARGRFAPLTRDAGVNLPGYALLSSLKLGR